MPIPDYLDRRRAEIELERADLDIESAWIDAARAFQVFDLMGGEIPASRVRFDASGIVEIDQMVFGRGRERTAKEIDEAVSAHRVLTSFSKLAGILGIDPMRGFEVVEDDSDGCDGDLVITVPGDEDERPFVFRQPRFGKRITEVAHETSAVISKVCRRVGIDALIIRRAGSGQARVVGARFADDLSDDEKRRRTRSIIEGELGEEVYAAGAEELIAAFADRTAAPRHFTISVDQETMLPFIEG